MSRTHWGLLAGVLALGIFGYYEWSRYFSEKLPAGFAASNGRIEAVEIDVATKTAGRLVELLVREGDFVSNGDVLAKMDTDVLDAQLRQAQADHERAKTAVEAAQSGVEQRQAEKAASDAVVAQREAEFNLASKRYGRREELLTKKVITDEEFDSERAAYFSAKATLMRAQADTAAAVAAIVTAKSQVIQAKASVDAAQAAIERIQADINDSTLRALRDGRVQYRIAEPGEVLGAGGRVLNMVDLADVYMTFFLPTLDAGRVKIGADVHLVLDAAPQYVIPAKVSFVADVAQFTPKTVETEEEREKLMFRIKASIAPELLKQHIRDVKTGLPGMAYVRLDERLPWPKELEVRLPR